MADEAGTETSATPEATAGPFSDTASKQSDSDEALGDGGKKALEAERRRANAAEKSLKSLQQRINDLESKELTREQQAEAAAQAAETRAAEAEQRALRFETATKHQLSREDSELFLVATDADVLEAQGARLAELYAAANKKPEGLYVPAEGRQPAPPPALNSDDLEVSLKRKLGIPL